MTQRVPSFFLLVPGPWQSALELVAQLAKHDVVARPASDGPIEPGAISVDLVHDDALAEGFAYGRAGRLPDELLAHIAACSRAALIEVGLRLDDATARVAALGRALQASGGAAVRMEQSGNASAWEPWLEKLDSGVPFLIYASAVIVVQDDDQLFFTCGMHHFDLPDAQVVMQDAQAAIDWLDTFCVYQLAEKPALASGHTFSPDAQTPRVTLERWPDHRHHPDDGRYNPFGVWRTLPPGTSRIHATELIPTIMPSLVAILLNQERAAGRPLTQREVEAIVDNCPAMSLSVEHAIAMERSRGYADIEPRLAWEQWQIVRTTL